MQRRIRHPFQCDIELAFDADQLLQLGDVHVLESLHLHRIVPPSPWSFARSETRARSCRSIRFNGMVGRRVPELCAGLTGNFAPPLNQKKRADTRRFMSVWPRRGALGDRATIAAGR